MNKSIRVLFLLIAMALALPGSLHAKATKATLTTIKEKLIQYQEIIAGTAAAGVVILITLLGWKYYSHKKSLKLNDGKENPINGQGNGNPPQPNKPEDDPGKKTKKEKKEKKEKKPKTPRTGSKHPADQSQPGDVPTHLHNPVPTQSSTNGNQPSAASTSAGTLRQEPQPLTDNPAPSASKGTGLKIQPLPSTPGSKHRPNITDFFAQSPVVDDKHHSAPVALSPVSVDEKHHSAPPIDHRGNTFYGLQPGKKTEGLLASYSTSSYAAAPIITIQTQNSSSETKQDAQKNSPAVAAKDSNNNTANQGKGSDYSIRSIGRATTLVALKDLETAMAQFEEEKQKTATQSSSEVDKRESEVDDLAQLLSPRASRHIESTSTTSSNSSHDTSIDATMVIHGKDPEQDDNALEKITERAFKKKNHDDTPARKEAQHLIDSIKDKPLEEIKAAIEKITTIQDPAYKSELLEHAKSFQKTVALRAKATGKTNKKLRNDLNRELTKIEEKIMNIYRIGCHTDPISDTFIGPRASIHSLEQASKMAKAKEEACKGNK